MKHQSPIAFSFIKILLLIAIALIAVLILTALLLIRTPTLNTLSDSTNQLVAVNVAPSYLHRLQTEQSITESTYFEDRLTINEQLYKIEVIASITEQSDTLHITVNVFSADHQFKGVAEGYVEVSYAQKET